MTNSLQGRTCGSLRKWCFILIAAGLTVSATAQEKYEQGKPNDDNYRYLDEYKALKEYIDYSKYPNFKLGAGTTVDDYLKKSTVYKMTNANFTETVAGNAMKMGSVVDGSGNVCPQAVTPLTAKLTGPASLAAFGNADLRECDGVQDNSHPAWHGRAMLVVRAAHKSGKIRATVTAAGLRSGNVTLNSRVR